MDWMTTGEVALLAGVATSTLRYYESIGLLPPPPRVSGQRRYGRDVLQILAVIQLAKDAHFSLPEIRRYRKRKGRLALLFSSKTAPHFSRIFFAFLGRLDFELQSFSSREKALDWLKQTG